MFFFVPAGVFAASYVLSYKKEPRRLRNGIYLVAATASCLLAIASSLEKVSSTFGVLPYLAALGMLVLVVVLAVFLIANGITMLRLERRGLGNRLSLLAGATLLVVPPAAVVMIAAEWAPPPLAGDAAVAGIGLLLLFGCSYVALTFTAYAVYSILYNRRRSATTPSAVVILGSGLVHGGVPPLLRSRLDKALELYRNTPAGQRKPLLVPSGGRGADEPRAEADAMTEYLVSQGVPPTDIAPENRSTSTRENIAFSNRIIEDEGRAQAPIVVTNDYHVLRAAVLARESGSPAHVVGSRTAAYYVPSAFIREYVAVMMDNRRLNAVSMVAAAVFFATLSGYTLPGTSGAWM